MGKNPPRRGGKKPASAPPKIAAATPVTATVTVTAPTPATTKKVIKEAPDRQVNAIYELLDSWENSAAIASANKLLKKYPDSHLLKALRAIATFRLGNGDDAYKLAMQVVAEQPEDLMVLQSLMFVLKPLGKLEELAAMYRVAYQANPGNGELAHHYFMAVARTLNGESMANLAVTLKRAFKGVAKFKYWHLCALFMQWQALSRSLLSSSSLSSLTEGSEEEETARECATLLDLMVSLARRLDEQGELRSLEEAMLVLEILKAARASAADRLGFIERHLAVIKGAEDRARMRLEVIADVDDLEGVDAASIVQDAVATFPEAWFAWEQLVKVHAKSGTIETYLDGYKPQGSEHASSRMLHLARMLSAQTRDSADPDALLAVWASFGHKPVFFTDVAPYLAANPDGYRDAVASIVHETQCTPKSVARGINVRKMRRSVGLDVSTDRDVWNALAEELATGREIDEDLLPTEARHADDFLQLLVLHLLDAGRAGMLQEDAAWHAIGLLETGVTASPSNPQFKLMLICLYLDLGCTARPWELYKSLEIKSLQYDTLGHFILDHQCDLGEYSASGSFSQLVQSIHAANGRETPDMIVEAFARGSYSKLPEFERFHHRLYASQTRAVALAEQWRAEIMTGNMPDTESRRPTPVVELVRARLAVIPAPEWTARSENRDFRVVKMFSAATGDGVVFPIASKHTADVRLVAALCRAVTSALKMDMAEGVAALADLDAWLALPDADAHPLRDAAIVVSKLLQVLALTASADDQAPAAIAYFDQVISALDASVNRATATAKSTDSGCRHHGARRRAIAAALETANLAVMISHFHPHIRAHTCAVHPRDGLAWLADPFVRFTTQLDMVLARIGALACDAEVAVMTGRESEMERVTTVIQGSSWAAFAVPGDSPIEPTTPAATPLPPSGFPGAMWDDWEAAFKQFAVLVDGKREILRDMATQAGQSSE
ncbi:N-acetyltransferase B complex non catalytic subunit-domain-containing protein [Blastocladiella britannica]|nr:N-acetyltransferase B complex non catalytic subunit-domain-containing protein [Blastocladiella britannica]